MDTRLLLQQTDFFMLPNSRILLITTFQKELPYPVKF